MSQHELKTWPDPFQAVIDGDKTYEIRVNDRLFAVGDELVLREWSPVTRSYTGRSATAIVSHMTDGDWGLPEGLCVMALAEIRMGLLHKGDPK